MIEVRFTFHAQVVLDKGGSLCHLPILFVFGVQHPQGILLYPCLALRGELIVHRHEHRDQLFPVRRSAFFTTNGINDQCEGSNPEFPVHVQGEQDDLNVKLGGWAPKRFCSELVKLSQPAGLRSFLPEHGALVVELEEWSLFTQVVLKSSTED